MTAIILSKGKWVVKDKDKSWIFDTHKEAQEKVDKLMSEKLKENKYV